MKNISTKYFKFSPKYTKAASIYVILTNFLYLY